MRPKLDPKRRGGNRPGAGNRKDDVATIRLDAAMRSGLNILVGTARMQRDDKVSHTQIVKELIAAEWARLDQAWRDEAEDGG